MKRAALSLALVALLSASAAQSQPAPPVQQNVTVGANLNITPKRVTFDTRTPRGRQATVYVFNQGTAEATFDISVVDRMMLPNGEILAFDEAQDRPGNKELAAKVKTASSMVQVSPRRVTLKPGQGQTVRLRALPPADASGEYRTHLTVTTLPPPTVGTTAEQAASDNPNELRFSITSIFGLSIPAIVRVGAPDVRAAIQNARIEYADISLDGRTEARRTPIMVFDLVRLGANSLFGNVEIRPAGKRGAEPIGLARGVGVYTEIDRRSMRIPLNRAPAPGEKLELTFTDDDTSPGNVLATLQVP